MLISCDLSYRQTGRKNAGKAGCGKRNIRTEKARIQVAQCNENRKR